MAGFFAGIKDAKASLGGNYLPPGGNFVLRCSALKMHDGHKGLCFISEWEVVESDVESVKPGSQASWVANITKHQKTALGNIKALLGALADIDPDDVDEEMAEAAVGDENPFGGELVRCQTTEILTKEAQRPFTKHLWSPANEAE